MHTWFSSLARRGRRLAPLLALLAAACGDGPTEPRPAPPPLNTVARVEITPDTVLLPIGGTRGLHAIPRTADGREVPGREREWRSSDESVARVDASGNVTALRDGTVTIFAVIDGTEGSARVVVFPPPPPPPVMWVAVSPHGGEMEPGQTRQLGVTLRAADGTLLTGRTVTWSSSDEAVAEVTAGGLVVAKRGGTATITATSEGRTGQTVVSVPTVLGFGLQSVGGAPLPAVIDFRSTTATHGDATLVTERRVRISAARLWVSTTDGRYRQRFTLQTWERTIQWFQGNSIVTPERLVSEREIADEGAANGFYDAFTGAPFYASSAFEGHVFKLERADGGRLVRQPLPGEGGPALDLRYTR